jgi:hypothetical protein
MCRVWEPMALNHRLPGSARLRNPPVLGPTLSTEAGHVQQDGLPIRKSQGPSGTNLNGQCRTQENRERGSHTTSFASIRGILPGTGFRPSTSHPFEPYTYPPGRGHRLGHGGWPPIQGRVGIEVGAMKNTASMSPRGYSEKRTMGDADMHPLHDALQ